MPITPATKYDVSTSLNFSLAFYLSGTATPATDMSAAMRTSWICKSSHELSLWLKWPGTSAGVTAPTGTWSIEVTNDSSEATGIAIPPADIPGLTAGQPAGTSGRLVIDPLSIASTYFAVVYTPSSGGSGAVATGAVGA